MLRQFVTGRIFNKLEAVLHVDCQNRDAEVVILFDRRIRRIEVVPFHEVWTPELAEKWLTRPAAVIEHGSWLEWHAMMCAKDPQWLVQQETWQAVTPPLPKVEPPADHWPYLTHEPPHHELIETMAKLVNFGLNTRAANAVARNLEVSRPEDLCHIQARHLLRIPNLGRHSLLLIERAMEAKGWTLAPHHPEDIRPRVGVIPGARDGGLPASHPDFYPPHLGGKPENWPK